MRISGSLVGEQFPMNPKKESLPATSMGDMPELFILHTCPFSWKVRGLLEHLDIEYDEVQVNALRTKKELAFTNGWNKVPVWRENNGEVLVDSTPMMKEIDSVIDMVVQNAGCDFTDIDVVIRTGGSSQIVAVKRLLESKFPRRVTEHDPFTSVAAGLAIASYHGYQLEG